MNPDKLFNYLDGKLPTEEREKLEDQLIRDPELQREFAIARKIHDRMSGNVREVILDDAPPEANRGRQIMRRVMIVFLALIFINTIVGVVAIGLLENRKNRARTAAEQNRKEMAVALQNAAASALPTPTLDVDEIKIAAPAGQIDALVEKITAAAKQVNGSAAKNVSNENGTLVFAEIPVGRISEFHNGLKQLGAVVPAPTNASPGTGNAILQIRITQ
jgi:hypothetical protein